MMAFFLVMWIVGQSKATKAGLAGYFRDPGVLEHERSTGILPGATERDCQTRARRRAAAAAEGSDETIWARRHSRAARSGSATMLGKLPDFEKLQGADRDSGHAAMACASS